MKNLLKYLYYYILISRSGLFDKEFYLSSYPDVRRADLDPLWHFIKYGWKEGRNPSIKFNTNFYLNSNPDVQKAGINPLIHFINYGKYENRIINENIYNNKYDFLYKLAQKHIDFYPKVSIIVPNYNHGKFLERRLNSIYGQTYKNYEVILLDDCSNDSSVEILRKYYLQYKEKTSLKINTKNSGSVFRQWKKGIIHSTGDLIWIAESDDFCDEDFLEKLVPFFLDESVMLSYAHSIFVDSKGKPSTFTYENYLSEIDKSFLSKSYIRTAHTEVNKGLGIKNTIPNASAVLFRKPNIDFELFEDNSWLNLKVCGDWILYLKLILGGKIGYCKDTNNYFCFHEANTTKVAQKHATYYKEHEKVAQVIARSYKISENILMRNQKTIQRHYNENANKENKKDFVSLYNFDLIKNQMNKRIPNILMVLFSFSLGGGEILPINLANELRKKGAAVTIFNYAYGQQNEDVRKMLHPQIPVINYEQSMSLNQIVSDFGIECIHSHHASMEYFIAKSDLVKNENIVHIATMHGMYEMIKDESLILLANQAVDQWCYIAEKNLSPFKNLNIYDENKFIKVNNGIPQKSYKSIDRNELGISSDSFVVCLASRALPSKGWLETIEAVRSIRSRVEKDIHLVILGTGDVYEKLKNQNLPEYIHLLGFKSNVLDYFAGSDAIILPSYYLGESVPLVIIESLYCEKPVIATNVGEISNMITDDLGNKAGILIDLNNEKLEVEDLIKAILKISTDNDFYNQCKITAQKLKNNFDIGKITEKYIEIYKKSYYKSSKYF